MNDYIHKTLIPATRMDAGRTGNSSTDDDDNADKEAVAKVFDTSNSKDESDGNGNDDSVRCRPSRTASKLAREITCAALRAVPVDGGDDS